MTSLPEVLAAMEFYAHVNAVLRAAELRKTMNSSEHVELRAALDVIMERGLPDALNSRAVVEEERGRVAGIIDQALNRPSDDFAREHPLSWVAEFVTKRTKVWLAASSGTEGRPQT